MPKIKRPVRSFVEGTQRGYAYGLKDGNERTILEYFVRDAKIGVDAAYDEASRGAASLLSTWKLKPRLIHRHIEKNMPKRNRKNPELGAPHGLSKAQEKKVRAEIQQDLTAAFAKVAKEQGKAKLEQNKIGWGSRLLDAYKAGPDSVGFQAVKREYFGGHSASEAARSWLNSVNDARWDTIIRAAAKEAIARHGARGNPSLDVFVEKDDLTGGWGVWARTRKRGPKQAGVVTLQSEWTTKGHAEDEADRIRSGEVKVRRNKRNPDTSGWEHSMDHLSRIAGIVTRMINAQNQGLWNDYEAAKRKYNVFAQRALDAGFTEADIDKAGEVGLEGVTTASW